MAKSKIGRNDLCLCGSGRKYKNCCLIKDAQKDSYEKAEREMVEFIMKYVNSKENRQDLEAAIEQYFGCNRAEINMNELDFNFFVSWYLNSYVSNAMEQMLNRAQATISSDIIKLLKNLKQSGIYFYRVLNIENNKVIIENLHNSNVLEVVDSVLEKNVNINDTLYARIYHVGKINKLFGGSMVVPHFLAEQVLEHMNLVWQELDKHLAYEDFLQIHALDIIKKLSAYVPEDKVLYNEENELLQYSITTYKVLELEKCNFILEGMEQLRPKKDQVDIVYQWIKKDDDIEYVIAEITIAEQKLNLETDSFERKENLQKLLENNLKETIELVDEEYFTISQLQEEEGKKILEAKDSDQIERLLLQHMKMQYKASDIKKAILLAKAHKARLKKIKPESVAAAMEYSVATQCKLHKTQKEIANKYNVSSATVAKWAKDISEYAEQ